MADGHTHSPTSFAPPASVHATAADALRLLAQSDAISSGFRLALKREIASLEAHEAECLRSRWSSMSPGPREPATLDAIAAEGARFDAAFDGPSFKARAVISKAARICEVNGFLPAYAALRAVEAALTRGDGSAVPAVERAQDRFVELADGDARVALLLLGTELLLAVREAA